MREHDGRTDVPISGDAERLDRAHFGKRLEAVLGHEAWQLQLVIFDGRKRVPDLPIMHVSDTLRVGIIFEVGARRTGPIWDWLSILDNHVGKHAVEQDHVVLPDSFCCLFTYGSFELLAVAPVYPSGFNLVVSAPDHDAGVIAEPLHLIDRFLPHIVE